MRETVHLPDQLHPFDDALLAIGGPVLLDAADAAFAWALARSRRRGAPKEARACASRPAVGVVLTAPDA